jgi:hypothetical protein
MIVDAEKTMRYAPKTRDEMRRYLAGCPGETPVEAENGVPVTAKTVAELRALSTCPRGDWVSDVPTKRDHRGGVVRVEWPPYTSF